MWSIVILTLVSLFAFVHPTFATQPLPKDSITVNPSLLSLDLSKDKPEGTLTYTNTSNQSVQLSLSASDFAPLEDGYKLSFLNEKDAANYRYSLSSWIDFGNKTLIIAPHASSQVTVFVDKNKLSPGGHYASIFAELDGNAHDNVQIHGVLASLLFVRTNTGKENDAADVIGFFPEQNGWDFPSTMIIRFNNTGDTTLIPYGLITITDPFGNYVAKGIVNDGSYSSLPESIRRFEIPVTNINHFFWPGMYKATLTIHFGKQSMQKKTTVAFFSQGSVPAMQILIILGVGSLLFFLLRKRLPLKRRREN